MQYSTSNLRSNNRIRQHTLIFIFSTILNFVSYSQTLRKNNLKGQVKSVTEYNYSAIEKFGKVQKDILHTKYIYKYDKNGICKERQEYIINASNHLVLNTLTKYVFNNKRIQWELYNSKNKLINTAKIIYILDERGNIIEESQLQADGKIMKETFTFNESDHLVERISYSWDGTVHNKTNNKYDDDGTLTESNYYPFKNLVIKSKFRYDAKGNLIEQVTFLPNGNAEKKTIYKYDSDNNLINESIVHSGVSPGYKDYIKFGNYDTYGNWLKQVTTWKGELANIIEREIEYYKEENPKTKK